MEVRANFYKEEDGRLLMVFPEIDEGNGRCACWSYEEQHGMCHPDYLATLERVSVPITECKTMMAYYMEAYNKPSMGEHVQIIFQ